MNQENTLHSRLRKIFLTNPPDSLKTVAKEMGINEITLKRFLNNSRPTYCVQFRLEKWIQEHERV